MPLAPDPAAIAARYGSPPGLAEELAALLGVRPDDADTVHLDVPVDPSAPTLHRDAPIGVAGRPTALPARYEDLGPLGSGGTSDVRRVRDRVLGRVAAMKILGARFVGRAVSARFVEESQIAAQLQHPGLVPIYDAGHLDDGRPWFTMREVRGRTLTAVILDVHAASGPGGWGTAAGDWTLQRLVDAFASVCDAVGYAHARGVLHRDLKPDNVMLGDHGEVLVLDWGLAKLVDRDAELTFDGSATHPDPETEEIAPVGGSRAATRMGSVNGTPAYMAPEQARGEVHRHDPRTDVYALGAILYELLTGRPPFDAPTSDEVLRRVREGHRPPPPGRDGPPVPADLLGLWTRAMAATMEERPADAGAVAAEVRAWLDGARERQRALDGVAQARATEAAAAELRSRAAELRSRAAAALDDVPAWAPPSRKLAGWALEDEAAAVEREAGLVDQRAAEQLAGALEHAPGLPEAHALLAARHRAAHEAAERVRDLEAAGRAEAALQTHAAALPDGHPVRRAVTAYLRGDATLSLVTDPPGADVLLHPYELRDRRLVPGAARPLGRTPLRGIPVAAGSYLCVLRVRGRPDVRYPVHLRRGAHWDGVGPGGSTVPVALPAQGDLRPDDVYVPAGWFRSGGDPRAVEGLPAEDRFLAGFVMRRHPVTNREYLAFLDDLVSNGVAVEVVLPREPSATLGELGTPIVRRAAGGHVLLPDAVGRSREPDAPVVLVDAIGARAFAAWYAHRTGHAWRLPLEPEWEKAARGVDGRFYPWGDRLDPSWCATSASFAGEPRPSAIHAWPDDESLYGVRGLAGNVMDRTAPADGESGDWIERGGAWGHGADDARCASRAVRAAHYRSQYLGFRLARSIREPER